jgi:hypothetical protein
VFVLQNVLHLNKIVCQIKFVKLEFAKEFAVQVISVEINKFVSIECALEVVLAAMIVQIIKCATKINVEILAKMIPHVVNALNVLLWLMKYNALVLLVLEAIHLQVVFLMHYNVLYLKISRTD